MVVVRLIGGLGNQLFQYAFGLSLAHIRGDELKLDVSAFETYTRHAYGLKPFSIDEKPASSQEVGALTGRRSGFFEKIRSIVQKGSRKSSHVLEKVPAFDKSMLELQGDVYLEGYWQSEKYFTDVEPLLRKKLNVRAKQTGQDATMAERIRSQPSISLHVRRGDYLWDASANQVHGTCDMAYYQRAVEQIAKTVKGPSLFVFTDDPDWAEGNLSFGLPTVFVRHNGPDKNYEDLRLMSQCDHHIIANSTFSWWGAWLNPNPEKRVIAPKAWFQDARLSSEDLVPKRWMRM